MTRIPALLAAALLVAATPARAEHDPLEAFNRPVHDFNQQVQRHVLGPIATLYLTHTPAPIRQGLANAAANLGEPVTAASALLAGDTDRAANAALRFALNTTLGLAGVNDVATDRGYPSQPHGLGDTLCRWGVPSGPYLVLPLVGPTTLRDATATAATALALSQALGSDAAISLGTSTALIDYTSLHPILAGIDANALDSYATYRSLHQQRRATACPVDQEIETAEVD